jgi:hypothetical protein
LEIQLGCVGIQYSANNQSLKTGLTEENVGSIIPVPKGSREYPNAIAWLWYEDGSANGWSWKEIEEEMDEISFNEQIGWIPEGQIHSALQFFEANYHRQMSVEVVGYKELPDGTPQWMELLIKVVE